MKNLKELNFNEMVFINGGELPYTENAVDGIALARGLSRAYHHTCDFFRGLKKGFFG
jgi:hypothetical protein